MSKKQREFSNLMREYHRYLGFFLAGIMAVYALSGIVLIFRDTDFLKSEKQINNTLKVGLQGQELGRELHIKNFRAQKIEGDIVHFKNGTYNTTTGEANYTETSLPFVLGKMTHLHKAKSGDPLFFLNIFFGVSLFFFVVSSFFMFLPKTPIFKKSMYFVLGGIVLTIIMLFV